MTALLIDDDATLRTVLRQAFELEDVEIDILDDPHAALDRITPEFRSAIITDVRMPGMDGLELVQRIRAIDSEIPVIVMTGHADVPMVVTAMRDGVFDFIAKPFAADHLIASVRRANEVRGLVLENRSLRADAELAAASEPLIGDTLVMAKLRDTIRQLAQVDVDVLIEGETGTGKELVALLLHRRGPRRTKPFIAVNCAALPASLAEGELFGYGPGVHAQHRGGRGGRIAASHNGTLFLDEIGSMTSTVQGSFLRVIEDREVWPAGADGPTHVDLRVVASTNVDLGAAVDSGAFRKDLYYRLNAVQLRLPPLRERSADIPLLFFHFLHEASEKFERKPPSIGRDIHAHLASHNWPGNARELRSFAQRVLLGFEQADIAATDADPDLATRLGQYEEMLIRRALSETKGDMALLQDRLGVPRNTLYDKLKRYGIKAAEYR